MMRLPPVFDKQARATGGVSCQKRMSGALALPVAPFYAARMK
jgi:hypothetical protein